MAKASRAGIWQAPQAFVVKTLNDSLVLTTQALQWVNDVYNAVLAPESTLAKQGTEIETLKQSMADLGDILPIDQADSTAADLLDGTIPGVEAAVTQLQNDLNNLLSTLRG